MELPIVEVPYLFHVGDLDATRPQRRASNEGCLLSVSIYPEEWTEILNIKQGTTYQLQPTDGAPLRLLDAKSIDEESRAALLDRAQEEGLLIKATMWKSFVPDEIGETWHPILHPTQEAAEEDARYFAGEPDFPGIQESVEYYASPELTAYWHSRLKTGEPVLPYQTQDAAISFLVERTSDLDGLWWDEDYTPEESMVARGGLFQRTIAKLSRSIDPDVSEIPDFKKETISVDLTGADVSEPPLPLPAEALQPDRRSEAATQGHFSFNHSLCSTAGTRLGR